MMEGWKNGRMEGWKIGRLEERKDGRLEEGMVVTAFRAENSLKRIIESFQRNVNDIGRRAAPVSAQFSIGVDRKPASTK
jgi:hypothetical protein